MRTTGTTGHSVGSLPLSRATDFVGRRLSSLARLRVPVTGECGPGSTKFAGSKFEHCSTVSSDGPEGVERMEREIILPGPIDSARNRSNTCRIRARMGL